MKRVIIFAIPVLVLIICAVIIVFTFYGKKEQTVNTTPNVTTNATEDTLSSLPKPVIDQETVIPMDGDANFTKADVDLDNDGINERSNKTDGRIQGKGHFFNGQHNNNLAIIGSSLGRNQRHYRRTDCLLFSAGRSGERS